MSSRVRQPQADRTPVLTKRPMSKGSPNPDSRSKFLRPNDPRSSAHVLKRPQEDDDFLKYGPKYKEAKLMLKNAQESYSGALSQLEQARRAIKRLKSRNSMLLTELNKDSFQYEPKPSKQISSTRVPKAPVMDKDGFAIPSLPYESLKSKKAAPQPTSMGRPNSKLSRRSRRDLTQARRVQPVPQDETGKYILPVNIGILTVVSLGIIEHENPKFHNDRYIWPVGYTVKRYYNSTVHADKQACYTASIVNDNGSPCFQIIADDSPEPIYGITATGAWTTVVRLANRIRSRNHSNSASGPDYYGFSHPTIAKMIQDLPNSRRCHKYNWQDFEMMDPKHVPTRKWHVPPADDSVSASDPAVDPSTSSAKGRSGPTIATSVLSEHKYELDAAEADKLLSQSDSGSSPDRAAFASQRSGNNLCVKGHFPEQASSSPISEGDFATMV